MRGSTLDARLQYSRWKHVISLLEHCLSASHIINTRIARACGTCNYYSPVPVRLTELGGRCGARRDTGCSLQHDVISQLNLKKRTAWRGPLQRPHLQGFLCQRETESAVKILNWVSTTVRYYERTSCLLEKHDQNFFYATCGNSSCFTATHILRPPPPSDFLDPALLRVPHISDFEKKAYDRGIGQTPFTFENIPYLRALDPV